MSKKHSKSMSKDEWLLNPKYKSWVKQISSNTARYSFCNKHIDVSSMGVSALESHSTSKKHKQIVSDRSKNYSMFFGKSSVSSPDPEKSVKNLSETLCKKNNTLDNFIAVSDNSLNPEILWCLKAINAHWSYNSCTDIAKLLHSMLPDSKIAGQFSMGKTKCRYIILYGLAPRFKSKLREAINLSIYYSLSFDENLNFVQQKCQMNLNVRFWNES